MIDHFRKETVRQQHLEQVAPEQHWISNITENQLMVNDLKRLISELVRQLPPQCKNVFHKKNENGLSGKEIAGELGISERAVNQHLQKAYAYLKTHLTKRQYEY